MGRCVFDFVAAVSLSLITLHAAGCLNLLMMLLVATNNFSNYRVGPLHVDLWIVNAAGKKAGAASVTHRCIGVTDALLKHKTP